MSDEGDRRTDAGATLQGLLVYVMWGFTALYWPLIKQAGALELLANRIVWSFVLVALLLVVLRKPWGWVRTLRYTWPRLLAAAVLIALNWLTYIWAVNAGHVAEASLGYFLNPLVNVVLGMAIFHERPARQSLLGIAFAAIGVAVIAFVMVKTVWVALVLAVTFGLYGVVKKRAVLGALEGLAVESGVLLPLALGYLVVLGPAGHLGTGVAPTLLLVGAGIVTMVPLWIFAIVAPRIPLSTLGMLQFVSPTLQLLTGLFVLGQRVPPLYFVGLALVWVGLGVYLTGSLRNTRRAALVAGEDV
ncbi:MAG TPA: EamA family transporter RarD [Propionibacteriaceae bacterium]|nr:EamA family transporter RarD [Propionibacteriaceae bacterium]